MTTTTATAASLSSLASSMEGRLVLPRDPDYDEVRRVFLGDVDARPAAIARAAGAGDVPKVICFARDSGIELAVRSGGHSNAGQSTTEGGLVLDLRDLTEIDIDPDDGTVWADAGLTALDLVTATYQHGLAVGFGDTGSVGIAGITLGGGIGYTVRKHGLTIDSLLEAELATADGRLYRVNAETEPDLFWAIRGGGGNFGVATRFRYRLHDVSQVYGGLLILPATPEAIVGFMEAAEAAREEVGAIANIMPAPPMPFLPEELVGRLVLFTFIVHVGDVAAGERAMGPFRALAQPLTDMLGPMEYPAIYPPEDPDYRPMPVQRTFFMDHVGPGEAEAIVEQLEASDASLRAVQLRVLGGAMAQVANDATAFAHRSRRIMGVVVAFHDPDGGDMARRRAWVDDLWARLRQGDEGAYVNFLGEEGEARVHAAYPGLTWDRLAAIKRRYDPDNLFRGNQNIPPAPAS